MTKLAPTAQAVRIENAPVFFLFARCAWLFGHGSSDPLHSEFPRDERPPYWGFFVRTG